MDVPGCGMALVTVAWRVLGVEGAVRFCEGAAAGRGWRVCLLRGEVGSVWLGWGGECRDTWIG